MRAITLSLGLILSLPLGMAAQRLSTNNVRQLSLEQCIQSALQRNFSIQIRRADLEIARGNLFSATGYYDTALDIQASYSSLVNANSFNQQGFVIVGGENNATPVTSGFTGTLPWGLHYDLGADFSYNTSTTPTAFRQTYNMDTGIALTQPLLRDFWIDSGRLRIKVNRSALKQSELELLNEIHTVVRDVMLNYYELVFAVENVGVNQKALELAERQASDNKKRVEVGTLAPLDEKQAEAQAATARAALIAALQTAGTQQRVLINLITDNYEEWQNMRLAPSESLVAIPQSYNLPASWVEALTRRPDFNRMKEQLEQKGIEVTFAKNQLYPRFDLFGTYGRRGIEPSFSDALADVRDENLPRWSGGIIFSIPLENRAARGTLKARRAEREGLQTQLQQLHQDILVNVQIAVGAAQAEFERVGASREAAQAAEAAYDAEVKKLENGKSTNFQVLDLQKKLTDARSLHIRALADYNRALTELYFREGTILDRAKIKVDH
ncbi:MAG TPA: TolC family protein [Candidatus Binatia bacterium]|nr:TolC family protein [Candidatus Binatia bacterium]